MKLTDFKVLTFDCYGTLIDWERGIADALQPLVALGGLKMPENELLRAACRRVVELVRATAEQPDREVK